jgi:hypothetical protein
MFTPRKGRKESKSNGMLNHGQVLRSHEFYQTELKAAQDANDLTARDEDDMETLCKASLTNAQQELKVVNKRIKKLQKKQGKLIAAGDQPPAKLEEVEAKLASDKILAREALNACILAQTHLHTIRKMHREETPDPARIPDAAMLPNKLVISLAMSERDITRFLSECETCFSNARFPKTEKCEEGTAHRWSSMLGKLVSTSAENKIFVDGLNKIPWDKAKKALIIRFATKSDKFHACPALETLAQGPSEDVTSYAERFETILLDTFGEGVDKSDGAKNHFFYQYLFQKGLRAPVQKALLADPKYAGCSTEPDEVLQICQQKERSLATAKLLAQSIVSIGKIKQQQQQQPNGSRQHQQQSSIRQQQSGKGQASRQQQQQGAAGATSSLPCGRCGRAGHVRMKCRASFSEKGIRLPGVPPGGGQPGPYRGCSTCNSQDHLARVCPSKRAQLNGRARRTPAVRAFSVQDQRATANSILGKRPHVEEGEEEVERDDAIEDNPGSSGWGYGNAGGNEEAQRHEDSYGCGLCGENHPVSECPEHLRA